MRLEIGPVACECPHCGTSNLAQMEVETFERSYVMRCAECACEFLICQINVVASFEPGACFQNVTAITSKGFARDA